MIVWIYINALGTADTNGHWDMINHLVSLSHAESGWKWRGGFQLSVCKMQNDEVIKAELSKRLFKLLSVTNDF